VDWLNNESTGLASTHGVREEAVVTADWMSLKGQEPPAPAGTHLPDDEDAVAARDQFPDHGRSGQLPGHEQPA
jgi:hypothetical protein